MRRRLVTVLLCTSAMLLPTIVPAADRPVLPREAAKLAARCARIENSADRLACYDELNRGSGNPPGRTFLERHWDIYDDAGRFRPWAHRPNSILVGRWTDSPNEAPFEAAVDPATGNAPDLQSVETKFQISFKTKLVERLLGGPGDLWFGYTQQSHFQVYNASESRPFRETDFEPELIVTFPLRRTWGGWTWRMLGGGVVHQSNGRSEPLSRSWNRMYLIAAAERETVSVQVKPWIRFDSTDPATDDNPQIVEYVGRLETIVQWRPNRHVFAFRGRGNLDPSVRGGSLQADWYFPIRDGVRGQLQVFTGYGESLIDYDHRQSAIGLGLLLFDPF